MKFKVYSSVGAMEANTWCTRSQMDTGGRWVVGVGMTLHGDGGKERGEGN